MKAETAAFLAFVFMLVALGASVAKLILHYS